MKADVEAEYGKEFTTFEPVSFRKQAVAQNVYYVKVSVSSDTSMVFVRIAAWNYILIIVFTIYIVHKWH